MTLNLVLDGNTWSGNGHAQVLMFGTFKIRDGKFRRQIMTL